MEVVLGNLHEYGDRIIDEFLSEYQSLADIDLSGMRECEIPICVERLNATAVSEDMKRYILGKIRGNLQEVYSPLYKDDKLK